MFRQKFFQYINYFSTYVDAIPLPNPNSKNTLYIWQHLQHPMLIYYCRLHKPSFFCVLLIKILCHLTVALIYDLSLSFNFTADFGSGISTPSHAHKYSAPFNNLSSSFPLTILPLLFCRRFFLLQPEKAILYFNQYSTLRINNKSIFFIFICQFGY